ncbi:MAG TPA: hypothetical protein VH437_01575 [Terriglobales bacterium]|jgi:hypothetical protein
MSGDLREKLAAALKIEVKTPCYIQQVYDQYKRAQSGRKIKTPIETVTLRDENFVYWIKLQWHNPQTKTWQDASPSIVLPLLEAGTFDEKGYRLEDPRRARVLPHLPSLLGNPDVIYKNGHKGIRGDHIYVQEYKGQLKVAFTIKDDRLKDTVLVSSFWTTKNWLARCVKEAPVYQKQKANP